MEDNEKKAFVRLSNTLGELADLLIEKVIEVPASNESLMKALGEARYQELTAKLQEADHAVAGALVYTK